MAKEMGSDKIQVAEEIGSDKAQAADEIGSDITRMAEEIGNQKPHMAEEANRSKDQNELNMLREIMLGPIFALIEQRDKKVLDFIRELSTDLVSRVNDLQAQLNAFKDEMQHRDNAVTDIADGIANLGSELRKVMANPESGQRLPDSGKPNKAA